MDRDEFLALQANKGGYIQLEGFTSTSLSAIQASSFIKDTWIQIKVNVDNLGGEIDWGFAYVEAMSSQPHEKEVIFNPINIFKVVECKEKGIAKLPVRGTSMEVAQYIELEYAPLTDMMKRKRNGLQLTEIEENIIINYEYQQGNWMEWGFMGQGHALCYCGQLQKEKALNWLKEGD